MTEKKKRQAKGHLYRTLQTICILPVFLLGIIIVICSSHTVTTAMQSEVRSGLENAANMTILTYDLLYPGDYHLQGEKIIDLLKGEEVLTGKYEIIDQIKEQTGMDITIFYSDTRILTTIRDTNGNRIIGTRAEARVLEQVLQNGQPGFYTNASINGVKYFAYYTPLVSSSGTVTGMAYAGKPCTDVEKSVRSVLIPLILITVFCTCLVAFLINVYGSRLVQDLSKVQKFMSKVAKGNLSTQIDLSILGRHDELSDMVHSAIHMRNSLQKLVDEDTLTGLNNRRFGDQKLKQIHSQSIQAKAPYTIVLCDIDFFKKVNDTYGHDMGDEVLKQVARVLSQAMSNRGFAIRWGGEEFLLIFPNTNLGAAKTQLDSIAENIRAIRVPYEETEISITMTFGMSQHHPGRDIRELLQEADDRLYQGKTEGRNRIIP